jgi:two-component system phosphate regulon response regulator PhoB
VTARVALIVEDDPLLQRAMAKLLEKAKLHVLTARHFNAAVLHLNAVKLDVACIDLGLPSTSGYELCEHIRRLPRLFSLPILVTSERSFPEDMAHAEEAGANAFLKKPFAMERLLKYASVLVDGPHGSGRAYVACALRLLHRRPRLLEHWPTKSASSLFVLLEVDHPLVAAPYGLSRHLEGGTCQCPSSLGSKRSRYGAL